MWQRPRVASVPVARDNTALYHAQGTDGLARGPNTAAMSPPSDVLLRVSQLCVRFGGIVALDGISFDVRRGEICGLIGPNGAGKTTLFNCLSRLYTPASGAIAFD